MHRSNIFFLRFYAYFNGIILQSSHNYGFCIYPFSLTSITPRPQRPQIHGLKSQLHAICTLSFIFRQRSGLFIAAVLSSYHHSLIKHVSDKPYHYVMGIRGHRPTHSICMVVLHCSRFFLLTASLSRRRMSIYVSVFPVAIPVNYTSDFREHFAATMYIPTDCILLDIISLFFFP